MRKLTLFLAIAACLCVLGSIPAWAEVAYLPDVTEEMSSPSFWSDKQAYPTRVLADQGMVDQVNASILGVRETATHDLANWPEDSYDGKAYAQDLALAATEDASYYYRSWVRIWVDDDGTVHNIQSLEEFEGLVVDNCVDQSATTSMPIQYGICTTYTCIRTFPRPGLLLDGLDDADFDYQCQTSLRVNEPVVIKGISNDGAYYHVYSSCTSGWVAVEDIAVCASKQQWLDAWYLDPSSVLVVCEDKIVTEDSNNAPQTANRVLSLGTCLRLANADETVDILGTLNRTGHNAHAVWLPVRNEDGSYAESLGLISEHCAVSEGYLPITATNVAKIALSALGNTYGWGGALHANDCSGYVRDVYRCFGLDLARNTNGQQYQPVVSYALGGMDSQAKADLLRTLPLGTVLFMSGHEMIYLGDDGDNLYVMSAVSRVIVDEVSTRVRGCVINTLNTKRTGGESWLDSIDYANIPFYPEGYEPPAYAYACTAGDGGQWCDGDEGTLDFVFERSVDPQVTLDHFLGIRIDGRDVDPSCYGSNPQTRTVGLVPECLSTLWYGEHTLTAFFDDGDATAASFTILPRATYDVVVEGTSDGVVRTNRSTADEGQEIVVTVSPNKGLALKSLEVTDDEGNAVQTTRQNASTYRFAMPASNVLVRASFVSTAVPGVSVTTHVQMRGWLRSVSNGKVAGTTGKGLRLEAFALSVPKTDVSGGIAYRSHIQQIGWARSWKRDGKISGSVGKSHRVEAVRIRLYGNLAKRYDVWYRVHAQGFGWMAWTKNGRSAGTQGMSRRIEAMQVVLVRKGAKSPAKTYRGATQSYGKAFRKR